MNRWVGCFMMIILGIGLMMGTVSAVDYPEFKPKFDSKGRITLSSFDALDEVAQKDFEQIIVGFVYIKSMYSEARYGGKDVLKCKDTLVLVKKSIGDLEKNSGTYLSTVCDVFFHSYASGAFRPAIESVSQVIKEYVERKDYERLVFDHL